VAPWLQSYLLVGAALQASFAWQMVPAMADGRTLDDAAHPASGPRHDPDDMLNAAGAMKPMACPITVPVLRRARKAIAAEGLPVDLDAGGRVLQVLLPLSEDAVAVWMLSAEEHPVLGPGALMRLVVPPAQGPQRAAWLANALNLAEAADWRGEDRAHALGAWLSDGSVLQHLTFLPSQTIGRLGSDAALLVVRSVLAWGAVRARFVAERLPWLVAAAVSRYPADEPPEAAASLDGSDASAEEEPLVPVAQRSFGPGARTPRPRSQPSVTHGPRELLVDPTDPTAYPEIDAAVAVAEDGDTVIVSPGTYRVPVVVDRAVRIEGRGSVEEVILEPVGGEALGVAASGAHIRGLTIRPSRAGNDGADHSAVAVHDASVIVEGCQLSSHLGASVWVGGPAAEVWLHGCVIANGAQNAVWVTEEARAEVVGCRITGHRWPIIVGGAHASLTVRDCQVLDNLDHGIVGADRATLVVAGCTIARNAVSGVLLLGAAPASRVEGCIIEENGGTGVFVEGGRGRIVGNRIRGNDVGVAVMEGAAPIVEDNELTENRLGLGVRGMGADPRIRANTISASRAEGVIVDESATGRFDSNTVTGSARAGIWVDDEGTTPRFSGNHVSGSAVGIVVTDGAGGDYRSNDLRGNARGSWHLDSPGPLACADNLEDAGVAGSGRVGPPPDPPGPAAPPSRLN
jgi:nitrous oxidase accessory protein NosD